jgi:hypothetical protein
MIATELFNIMVVNGTTTRENIDKFFALLSTDTLDNQIAMTLASDDFCLVYTTIDNNIIKVIE